MDSLFGSYEALTLAQSVKNGLGLIKKDIMDEFVETITETDNGYSYTYGDEQRPVESFEVSLKFLNNKNIDEKSFTIFRTHHGPITHTTDGKWIATPR